MGRRPEEAGGRSAQRGEASLVTWTSTGTCWRSVHCVRRCGVGAARSLTVCRPRSVCEARPHGVRGRYASFFFLAFSASLSVGPSAPFLCVAVFSLPFCGHDAARVFGDVTKLPSQLSVVVVRLTCLHEQVCTEHRGEQGHGDSVPPGQRRGVPFLQHLRCCVHGLWRLVTDPLKTRGGTPEPGRGG